MSLLLSQLGAQVTPSIVAGWADWELPQEDVEQPNTEESFVSFLPFDPPAVDANFIQFIFEEDVEEEDVEIWQPQLFDPWTTNDVIFAVYADNEDEEEEQEGWIGFWDEPSAVPPATDFVTGWTDEDVVELEDEVLDFTYSGPTDDAPVVPPVLTPQQLAELYGGNIFKVRKAKKREEKRKKPSFPQIIQELVDGGAKQEIVAILPKREQGYLREVSLNELLARVESATAKVQAEIRRLWVEREDQDDQHIIDILLGVEAPVPYKGDDDEDWFIL